PEAWQRRQRNGQTNNPRNRCLLRRPPEPGPRGVRRRRRGGLKPARVPGCAAAAAAVLVAKALEMVTGDSDPLPGAAAAAAAAAASPPRSRSGRCRRRALAGSRPSPRLPPSLSGEAEQEAARRPRPAEKRRRCRRRRPAGSPRALPPRLLTGAERGSGPRPPPSLISLAQPGLASQRPKSQTSIMAAASERRALSAAASRRPNTYPAAQRVPPHHRLPARPPPPPPRGGPGHRRSSRGGGRLTGRTERRMIGLSRAAGRGQERPVPDRRAPLSMPSVTARGSLGLVPKSPPVTALATAAAAATQDDGRVLNLGLYPEPSQREQAPDLFTASNSSLVLRGYLAPPLLDLRENPVGWIALGPGPARPPPAVARALDAGLQSPSGKYGTARRFTPASGRDRGEEPRSVQKEVEGYRGTVGTTFKRRSRVLLLGELSKFPLPCDSSRSKCFGSFARCRRRDPEVFPVAADRQAQTSLPPERCRGWRLGSWLHKYPHPSTCPRLPSPLPAATDSCRPGSESSQAVVPPLLCYPQEPAKGLRPEAPSAGPVNTIVGKGGWAPGGWSFSPVSALPITANSWFCAPGAKGYLLQQPAARIRRYCNKLPITALELVIVPHLL
ncbi:Killin, partial [Galemys pyrenaicus]